MNWWKSLKGKVKLQEPLKKHTAFKIGGPAKYFIEPNDIRDLKLLLNLLKRYKIPFWVMGAASNILVSDNGIYGAVLRLSSPYFKKVVLKDNSFTLGSGVLLNQVVLSAQRYGLSGVEFLAGIPGTLGGALIMNAGIPEKNIGELVEAVTVIDYNGKIKALSGRDIKFGYRISNLSKYIILSASIKLVKKKRQVIQDNIKRYLDYRRLRQDLSRPSAGCVFKNPLGYSAGKLIDLCGLKGRRIKDAYISKRHANFILNLGKAKAKDVCKLMGLIKKEVKRKFNITLEPEIKIWQ